MDFFERLEAVHDRWNVLRHPFYRRWECGELTRHELADYAGEYRHAVVALAQTASVAGAEHASEEAEHVGLWDAFAAALGTRTREPRPETVECVRAWTAGDQLEALGIIYAVESAQPAISETKLAGLIQHYGFRADSPAASYFAVHAERDREHAEASRAELEAKLTEADAERLLEAAEGALRGNWRLLDGVNR